MNRSITKRFALTLAVAGLLANAAPARADCNAGESDDADRARVKTGYAIAPVPLDSRGKDWVLVGLGSYIVNAQSACADRHAHPSFAPGGDPYQGRPGVINSGWSLAGGKVYGPFTSANITPDAYGRPAGLTLPESLEAIRSGHGPDGSGRILQVMPCSAFRNRTDHDLRAVDEHLRAIPSRPDNPNPRP